MVTKDLAAPPASHGDASLPQARPNDRRTWSADTSYPVDMTNLELLE